MCAPPHRCWIQGRGSGERGVGPGMMKGLQVMRGSGAMEWLMRVTYFAETTGISSQRVVQRFESISLRMDHVAPVS